MNSRFNFTKKSIEALPTPTEKRAAYRDTTTRGLGLLVQPTGYKSFYWFRKVRGYPTWQTIGAYPDLTVEQARAKASELNTKNASWKANDYDGPDPFTQRRDITLDELIEMYLERQVKAHAARPDRAVRDTKGMVKTYLTAWKPRRLRTIRHEDVQNLHEKLGSENGKVTANRVVQFLRTLFNWAEEASLWKGENPATRIKFFHEDRRTRFLQPDELPRFFKALRADSNLDLQDFVLLALFTGARRGDIFSMRWGNVSLADNRWEVPNPKNRKPYVIALTPEAVEILEKRRKRVKDTEWVFPSWGSTHHLVNLKKPWQRLLKAANISGLVMHDLRRTLGSWQAGLGSSLQIIGKSLGHSSTRATEVYSHLVLDPVRASVEPAVAAIVKASKKKPKLLRGASGG